MTETQAPSSWKKAIAIGCAAILALCVTLVIVVAFNWKSVTGLYHRATATLGELMTVRAVLQQKYQTAAINVSVNRQSGVDGATLSVTFTNPPFLPSGDFETPEARQKALEIATTARDALPAASRYGQYVVVFTRQTGVGVTFSMARSFPFSADDLPPTSTEDATR